MYATFNQLIRMPFLSIFLFSDNTSFTDKHIDGIKKCKFILTNTFHTKIGWGKSAGICERTQMDLFLYSELGFHIHLFNTEEEHQQGINRWRKYTSYIFPISHRRQLKENRVVGLKPFPSFISISSGVKIFDKTVLQVIQASQM